MKIQISSDAVENCTRKFFSRVLRIAPRDIRDFNRQFGFNRLMCSFHFHFRFLISEDLRQYGVYNHCCLHIQPNWITISSCFCQSEQVLISGQIRPGMAALLVILCCRIKIAEKNAAFSRKICAFHPEKQPFRDLIYLKRF